MKMTYQEIQKIIEWNKENIPNGDIYCEMIMQDAYDLKEIDISSEDFWGLLNYMIDIINDKIINDEIKCSEKVTLTNGRVCYIKDHCYNIRVMFMREEILKTEYLKIPILDKHLKEYKNECI